MVRPHRTVAVALSVTAALGAGRAVRRTFVIGKAVDKASPQLLARLANGQHIASVVVTQDKPAGTFLRYTLSDVQIVDYEHTGRTARNAEKVCLRFNRAEVEYLPQQPDGTLGTAVRATLER